MPDRTFSPGLRISSIDVAVLIVAIMATAALCFTHFWISGVIAFVVGHFFLFCNVFCLSRPLELVWAGVFLVLTICTTLFEMPGWGVTYAVSLAATAVVVAIEMHKPSYHGILWQRINPTLRDWWESKV